MTFLSQMNSLKNNFTFNFYERAKLIAARKIPFTLDIKLFIRKSDHVQHHTMKTYLLIELSLSQTRSYSKFHPHHVDLSLASTQPEQNTFSTRVKKSSITIFVRGTKERNIFTLSCMLIDRTSKKYEIMKDGQKYLGDDEALNSLSFFSHLLDDHRRGDT